MIRIEDKAFRKKLNRLKITHGKRLKEIVRTSTTKMHRYAVHKAPVDDGKLKQGLQMEIDTAGNITEGVLISKADYSQAVEEGTRPHTIKVQKKQVLAGPKRKAQSGWDNYSRDWAIYGKEVQHPGTDAQPFVYPAWRVGHRYMIDRIKKMFK